MDAWSSERGASPADEDGMSAFVALLAPAWALTCVAAIGACRAAARGDAALRA